MCSCFDSEEKCLFCRNAAWGLRDIDDVTKLAAEHGLHLDKVVSAHEGHIGRNTFFGKVYNLGVMLLLHTLGMP